jgi:hypothetical protein
MQVLCLIVWTKLQLVHFFVATVQEVGQYHWKKHQSTKHITEFAGLVNKKLTAAKANCAEELKADYY